MILPLKIFSRKLVAKYLRMEKPVSHICSTREIYIPWEWGLAGWVL